MQKAHSLENCKFKLIFEKISQNFTQLVSQQNLKHKYARIYISSSNKFYFSNNWKKSGGNLPRTRYINDFTALSGGGQGSFNDSTNGTKNCPILWYVRHLWSNPKQTPEKGCLL